MGSLSVTVRRSGQVVQDVSLAVDQPLIVGDAPAAAVRFPAPPVSVERHGTTLRLNGQPLRVGDTVTLQVGGLNVTLQHCPDHPGRLAQRRHFDTRFLVVLAIVGVSIGWLNAFESWASVHLSRPGHMWLLDRTGEEVETPGAVGEGTARLASTGLRGDTTAPPSAPLAEAGVGPKHKPDDQASGVRWYRWYRAAAPIDADQHDAAVAAHLEDPRNPMARAVLGQLAYNEDRFEESARYFRALVEEYPEDFDACFQLARAEMRLGHHRAEARHLRTVLRQNVGNHDARGALAVALARLQRLDEAAVELEELRIDAPNHPATRLAEAKVAALAGKHADALEQFEELMHLRHTLTASVQLEIRRDIAMDPAFGPLRKNVRLRSLITRHFGAAGPRPIR